MEALLASVGADLLGVLLDNAPPAADSQTQGVSGALSTLGPVLVSMLEVRRSAFFFARMGHPLEQVHTNQPHKTPNNNKPL